MSRAPVTFDIPDPPAGLTLSPVPDLRGAKSAAEWINEHMGIAVTVRYITQQTNDRKIPCALIMGARYYSTESLYRFILSKTRPATAS